MTAQILVVDDLEPNVKLLEAKLTAEYYGVLTAMDGFEAIAQAKKHSPDIILLDVMMPQIDGFETCRRLKADPATAHIPVVMVTALSDSSDRIQGLQAGADDFITKPIKEVQLLARVRSLVRIKMLIDELRLRGETSSQLAGISGEDLEALMDITGEKVMLIDDDIVQSRQVIECLEGQGLLVNHISEPSESLSKAMAEPHDMFIVSTQLADMDGLRLCSQLRSSERTRYNPQLIMVDEDDEKTIIKGLEMGVNDYLVNPIDLNEMVCRVRTNLRRKKYQDALKSNYRKSVSMAITDGLTGLYNRHYLNAHIEKLVRHAHDKAKPLSCLMLDMDHFKLVNDSYGHDVGDEVLKELSRRIVGQTRSSNLVARFGGEEFVVLLPGAEIAVAREIAERIRQAVEMAPFKVSHEVGSINKTISIGVAALRLTDPNDTGEAMMKRGDDALYQSKNNGRNLVTVAEDDALLSTSFAAAQDVASEEAADSAVEEMLHIAEQPPIVSPPTPGKSPESNRFAKVQDVLYQPGIIETASLADEPGEPGPSPAPNTGWMNMSGQELPEPPEQAVNPALPHGPISVEADKLPPEAPEASAFEPLALQRDFGSAPEAMEAGFEMSLSGVSASGKPAVESAPNPAFAVASPNPALEPPPPQQMGLGGEVFRSREGAPAAPAEEAPAEAEAAEPSLAEPSLAEPSLDFLKRAPRPSYEPEDQEVTIAPEDVVLGIRPSMHKKADPSPGLLDKLIGNLLGRKKEPEPPAPVGSGISPAAGRQTDISPTPSMPIRPVDAMPSGQAAAVAVALPAALPSEEGLEKDDTFNPPWLQPKEPAAADAPPEALPQADNENGPFEAAPKEAPVPHAVPPALELPGLELPGLEPAEPETAREKPEDDDSGPTLIPEPQAAAAHDPAEWIAEPSPAPLEMASPPGLSLATDTPAGGFELTLETPAEPAMPDASAAVDAPAPKPANPFTPDPNWEQRSPMEQAAAASASGKQPLFGTPSQMRPMTENSPAPADETSAEEASAPASAETAETAETAENDNPFALSPFAVVRNDKDD